MANQAIALGVRTPQVDILGGSIQRNAQMINMIAQQRAAERQAALAQQEMQRAQAIEAREASAAEIEMAGKKIDYYTKRAGQVMNAEGYNLLLNGLDKDAPDIAAAFRANLPPEKFDRNLLLQMVGSIGDNFKSTFGPLEHEVVQREDGTYLVTQTGGFGEPAAYELREYAYTPDQPAPSAAAAPQAPSAFDRAFGEGIPAGEEAINAAAQAIANNAGVSDPALKNLTPKEFDEANLRAGKLMLAKPIAAEVNAGAVAPLTVENAPQIVEAALKSGFIDPSHVEQLKQMVGPENGAAVDQWVQQSGLKTTGAMPGMRSAVYRPQAQEFGAPVADDGMSFSGPANALRQDIGYVPTGRTARGKPPTVGALPGSSQVPIPRVAAEARAQRETPDEVYAKEKARAKAQREAALEAGPKPLTPVQEAKLRDNIAKDYKSAQSTIDMMLNPVSGVIAAVQSVRKLTPEQKEAITGWSGYVPSISASSRSADTKIKNLKGKVTEMGKAAASLTGAIGQMAVQEWRIVSDMIANLDLEGMNASDLDDQLQIIESQARRAAAVTQDAYENQYVEEFARYPNRFQLKVPGSGAPAKQTNTSNLPRVRNNADFNRLKPGTLFIDPNGETRRKP